MKESIRILLLGDDGVGKSSLLSCYISRHFPQEVPAVMIDSVIPAETTANNIAVTIMDSSSRLADRDKLKQKILLADSYIVLYDLTRPETFDSVLHDWLPLIQEIQEEQSTIEHFPDKSNQKNEFDRLSTKPTIVLGTKLDLLVDEVEDTERLRTITALFPSVIMCLRCSAARLQDVDPVFHYGEMFVTFPLGPIFHITNEEFTPRCSKAFQRIFRMFDVDGDNLLSDNELCELHSNCFYSTFHNEELLNLKRQISNMMVGGLHNNRITFDGFLGMIKTAIDKNELQTPWNILNRCDYDDNLNLLIPEEIFKAPKIISSQKLSQLSDSAREFLLNTARNAYEENAKPIKSDSDSHSEIENCLSWGALGSIFSVLSGDENHQWICPPSYKGVWSLGNELVPLSVLLIGLPHTGATCSFDDWLSHWELLALCDPVLTQVLLFKLGYAERADLGIAQSIGTIESLFSRQQSAKAPLARFRGMFTPTAVPSPARSIIKICILGDNRVGKSSFVWHMSGLRPPGVVDEDVEKSADYDKPLETIVIGGYRVSSEALLGTSMESQAFKDHEYLSPSVFISLAAIPLEHTKKWLANSIESCDLTVLMFECGDMESLDAALEIESLLPPRMPRMFIGNKVDILHRPGRAIRNHSSGNSEGSSKTTKLTLHRVPEVDEEDAEEGDAAEDIREEHEKLFEELTLHIQENDLPKVPMISTIDSTGISETLLAINSILKQPETGIPVKYRAPKTRLYQRPLYIVASLVSISTLTYFIVQYKEEIKSWWKDVLNTSQHWLSLMQSFRFDFSKTV